MPPSVTPARHVLQRAAALLTQFGSPLYVYDADEIRRRWSLITTSIAYPHSRIHYAIVCNKNAHIVKMLNALGAGIHANTPGDAFAALRAGVPSGDIVYSGSNLDAEDLRFLVDNGIHLNVDSIDQVRDLAASGRVKNFGLRYLIDDADGGNRMGVTDEEVGVALEIARAEGMKLTALHMYAGTNTRSTARFVQCVEKLVTAAKGLPDLVELNIGGGYGVAYEDEAPLDLREVGERVADQMRLLSAHHGRTIGLIMEPGRTLVASAGTLLVTVVSVKERGGKRFVGVDSTVGNIVVPSVYHRRHRVLAVANRSEPLDIPTDVCGNTTHSRDFLARDIRLPPLEKGNVLALCDVGAYGYAMSSHFLNRPRPAEVLLDGAMTTLTTRRETLEDLLNNQVNA